jgi:hypothetical protein
MAKLPWELDAEILVSCLMGIDSVADVVWPQLTLRRERDMGATNPQPESEKRRLPSSFLVIVVAVLAGAGVSRMLRAVSTPEESGGSTQVNAPLEPDSSAANSTSGTAQELAEQLSSQSIAAESADDESTRRELAGRIGELIASDRQAAPDQPVGSVAGEDSAAETRKRMLGTWEDDYKGHRTLTLNADGTGTMVVELDGLSATLFAKKLTFREEWTVADGKVTMKATGGEPAGKVQLVLSLHGDSSTQKIIEVTSERMILIEEPSETRFEWRRLRDAQPKLPVDEN